MTVPVDIPTAQILIVEDEIEHAEVMAEALRRLGHVCTIVHDLSSAQDEMKHGQFDLIVTDLVMDSEEDGLKVLAIARRDQPHAETVLVTAHGDVPTCRAALKQGAFDFIEKPLDLDVFRSLISHALHAVMIRNQGATVTTGPNGIQEEAATAGIIGTSPAIRMVLATLRRVATSNLSVLITGESGTGKELFAAALHGLSQRKTKHFVPLNCAGLSETILEDELFGHVRGAFTGADRERQGRFEYADKGTLFLDEVGDMPMVMQAKLLRVLESGEVVRMGSNEPRHVDVRLVSATHRDLDEMVKTDRFREDLFFRIRGVEIRLPALRERVEDIPLLARALIDDYARRNDLSPFQFADDTLAAMMRYPWPGNVRQLRNVVQNVAVIADSTLLEPRHLPPEIRQTDADDVGPGSSDSDAGLSLDQIEKRAIREALRIHKGNREQAAKMLGIGERTLYRKLKEYGLK